MDQRQPRKVVIIDDDPSMRELVSLHLRNAGYEVLAAEDAVAGGRLVLERRPDLVICDVDMPYLDGYEFVRAIKADPSTAAIPVVFLTVKEDVAEKARQLGAAAFLMKPVSARRLLDVVALFAG